MVTAGERLVGLRFEGGEPAQPALPGRRLDLETDRRLVRAQLDEYFAGARATFDVPVGFGGTPFQRDVWAALVAIPHAQHRDLSGDRPPDRAPCGRTGGGRRKRQNPISIIVPCHRLVGAGGDLTGYGWGLERKAWLLDHERGGGSPGAGCRRVIRRA